MIYFFNVHFYQIIREDYSQISQSGFILYSIVDSCPYTFVIRMKVNLYPLLEILVPSTRMVISIFKSTKVTWIGHSKKEIQHLKEIFYLGHHRI